MCKMSVFVALGLFGLISTHVIAYFFEEKPNNYERSFAHLVIPVSLLPLACALHVAASISALVGILTRPVCMVPWFVNFAFSYAYDLYRDMAYLKKDLSPSLLLFRFLSTALFFSYFAAMLLVYDKLRDWDKRAKEESAENDVESVELEESIAL